MAWRRDARDICVRRSGGGNGRFCHSRCAGERAELKKFSSRRLHDDVVNGFSWVVAVIMELTGRRVQLESRDLPD